MNTINSITGSLVDIYSASRREEIGDLGGGNISSEDQEGKPSRKKAKKAIKLETLDTNLVYPYKDWVKKVSWKKF